MKRISFVLMVLLIVVTIPAFSQQDPIDHPLTASDTLKTDFGLFTHNEILNLSLRFDLVEYTRTKPKEEYMKATLTYHLNDKDSINKEIKLKSRGEMRNGYCDFPPIRLNFKNAGFEKKDLSKIEKIKLVTHCQYGNEENLFKEYLIYKLYNVMTDTSFRVRLVKIDYINTNPKRKRKPVQTYAFLIEPVEMLAARIKSVPIESTTLTQKHIRGRLAESLILLADKYGFEHDGITLQVYMSREDIANLSNMTTSNAIRTLSTFANEKLIAIDGRKIKILDMYKLDRISKLG